MIKVTKVDLHSLNVGPLNALIDAGWKPVAYVPYGAKMAVFLEGEEKFETGTTSTVEEFLDASPVTLVVCSGVTKAGDPCRGAPYKDTLYCVAHQDQG